MSLVFGSIGIAVASAGADNGGATLCPSARDSWPHGRGNVSGDRTRRLSSPGTRRGCDSASWVLFMLMVMAVSAVTELVLVVEGSSTSSGTSRGSNSPGDCLGTRVSPWSSTSPWSPSSSASPSRCVSSPVLVVVAVLVIVAEALSKGTAADAWLGRATLAAPQTPPWRRVGLVPRLEVVRW